MSDPNALKKLVGYEAADRFVVDGMKLGLGTGSTAIWAVRRVAERVRQGLLRDVHVVTTSLQTELEARSAGLPVLTLNDALMAEGLDLTIDGADEVDADLNLIKGGGGALLVEKIIAYASARLIIVVDESKLSRRLCEHFPVPIEVVAAALAPVTRRVKAMGAAVSLRMAVKKAGPVITDLGNLLLDAAFPPGFDPRVMEDELKLIPGVLEDGIFTKKLPELLVATAGGGIEHRKAQG